MSMQRQSHPGKSRQYQHDTGEKECQIGPGKPCAQIDVLARKCHITADPPRPAIATMPIPCAVIN